MSLQNLLDEFKGRSLLDTSVMTLPSPIMLELLEMKGHDRNEEEEVHYQRLVKSCPRFKVKGYCSDEMSVMTSEQVTFILNLSKTNTVNRNSQYYLPKEYKQKRKTPQFDWNDLREKILKDYENKPCTVLRAYMPTERDIQVHQALNMSSVTDGIYPRIDYPLFKTTATAENEHD